MTYQLETPKSELITLARQTRGLTQSQLAEMASITQGALSKIELGVHEASEEIIKKIAEVLHFPPKFFYQTKKIDKTPEYHYRKKASTSKKSTGKLEGLMNIIKFNVETLIQNIEMPQCNLFEIDIDHFNSETLAIDSVKNIIKDAANQLREVWSVPKGPIQNIVNLLENNGIFVFDIDLSDTGIDGLSLFADSNVIFIIVNKNTPMDRLRFTIAHELGHLILHYKKHVDINRDVEKEANLFASEFLIPSDELYSIMESNFYFNGQKSRIRIDDLKTLKSHWKVSMAAIMYRLNEDGFITSDQYRSLITQFGKLGWRKNEPIELPVEKPSLFREILTFFKNDLGYSNQELSYILNLYEDEIEDLYMDKVVRFKIVRN